MQHFSCNHVDTAKTSFFSYSCLSTEEIIAIPTRTQSLMILIHTKVGRPSRKDFLKDILFFCFVCVLLGEPKNSLTATIARLYSVSSPGVPSFLPSLEN